MKFSKVIYLMAAVLLFFSTYQPAYAYLDPGTGSIIIQSIIGGLAAAATFGAIYWSKVKSFISRCFGKSPPEEEPREGNDNT